jgi:hypothetical protein
MNITGEMWTMKNLHGNHNANIMIKFGHYNMTKIMMCHHVGLLWLKHAIVQNEAKRTLDEKKK